MNLYIIDFILFFRVISNLKIFIEFLIVFILLWVYIYIYIYISVNIVRDLMKIFGLLIILKNKIELVIYRFILLN